jgi:Ca2+-binding EF-hand superfamily protein
MFKEADADSDGKLTFEEMQALQELRRKKHQQARFERLDTDGDGAVSELELARPAERHWMRMDRNDDDVITRDEIGRSRMGRDRSDMHQRRERRHYRR